MTLMAVEIDGQVYVDHYSGDSMPPRPDPVTRVQGMVESILASFVELTGIDLDELLAPYEPSGLDEFHPDTTHNP